MELYCTYIENFKQNKEKSINNIISLNFYSNIYMTLKEMQ